MGNIVKDPDFPLQHVQITELKNTTKMTEQVKESDILITRNGESVAYLVNPSHYEALVTHWNQTHTLTLAERFLRHGSKAGNTSRMAIGEKAITS